MGCLLEHSAAKTSTGGGRRFRELARIMRRHCDRRYPPGYIVYGLDTYGRIWDEWIERRTPAVLRKPTEMFRRMLQVSMGYVIGHAVREAQGWYSDGWATTRVHYMLPPGNGRLRLRGSVPDMSGKREGPTIRMQCNGTMQEIFLNCGEFDVTVEVPATKVPAKIVLLAGRYVVPRAEGLGL